MTIILVMFVKTCAEFSSSLFEHRLNGGIVFKPKWMSHKLRLMLEFVMGFDLALTHHVVYRGQNIILCGHASSRGS